jgi:hypothetical protein
MQARKFIVTSPSLFEELPVSKRETKKATILRLFQSGIRDINQLAEHIDTRPSYIATVLQQAGLLQGYCDLYTTTSYEQNSYSKFFRNVLSFKDLAAAQASVARIDSLYRYFARMGDRAGQHQAQVLALIGRNRARWCGKQQEAAIFTEWLMQN